MARNIPELLKDVDTTISWTISCDDDLTGATITFGLLPFSTNFDGDLDDLMATASAKWSTTEGNVTIVDGEAGTGSITVDDADTADLAPGTYWMLCRIVLASGEVRAPKASKIQVVV